MVNFHLLWYDNAELTFSSFQTHSGYTELKTVVSFIRAITNKLYIVLKFNKQISCILRHFCLNFHGNKVTPYFLRGDILRVKFICKHFNLDTSHIRWSLLYRY